jgi:ABC-2 type transport system permease protein
MMTIAFKEFFRSRGAKLGMLFILLAVLISLLVGKQFKNKLVAGIKETAAFQQEQIDRNVQYHKDDIGLLLYYARFALIYDLPPIAALAIGQRDINPSIQSITIRAVEGQKYDAEITNPSNLHIGNIDFSFVLIALFPLLIIVFTYNLVSEQQESGTWKMVSVHTKSRLKFLLKLLMVRLLPITALVIVSLLVAAFALDIPLDITLLVYGSAAVSYILVWFAICFCVISFQRSSNFNAVALLSIWLSLVLVIPALINNYLVNRYPVPEAFATAIKQRNGYHDKWDTDRNQTMQMFYAHYPQYQKYQLPDKPFSWLWYYAMQQMGDDEAAVDARMMSEKLHSREMASAKISYFVPTLHMQQQLNRIAHTGLSNHLKFLDSTSRFHEKMRLQFYPLIFENLTAETVDWKRYVPETFRSPEPIQPRKIFLPLLAMISLFVITGCVQFSKSV